METPYWDLYTNNDYSNNDNPSVFNDASSNNNVFDFGNTDNSSFDMGSLDSWFNGLSNTLSKATVLKTQFEDLKGSNEKEEKQRQFEKVTQETEETRANNNTALVYVGIGAVALFFILGGD